MSSSLVSNDGQSMETHYRRGSCMSPGLVLLRRFVRFCKNGPPVDQVEFFDANPTSANIRYSNGRGSTASIRDLAPSPRSKIIVTVIKILTIMGQPLFTKRICCQMMRQTSPLLKMMMFKRRFFMFWRRPHHRVDSVMTAPSSIPRRSSRTNKPPAR